MACPLGQGTLESCEAGPFTSRRARTDVPSVCPREVLSLYTPAGRPLPLRGFSAQRSDPLPRVCRSPGEQGQRRTPSGSALRVARAGQSCGYLKSQRDREGTVGVRWCPTPGSHWLCVGLFCTRVLSGNDPASVVWLRLRPRWLRVQSGFCDGLGGQGTDGTLETRAVPQPVMYPAPSPHWTSDTRGVFVDSLARGCPHCPCAGIVTVSLVSTSLVGRAPTSGPLYPVPCLVTQ